MTFLFEKQYQRRFSMKQILSLFILSVSFMQNACKPTLSRSYISFFVLLAKNSAASVSKTTSPTTPPSPPIVTLTYPNTNFIFYLHKEITVITPSVVGSISSFSINPVLPTGLNFDSVTGQITGTPTVLSAATSYTVTGTYASGITTVSFSLSIVDIPPSSLTYIGSPYSFPDFIPIATITPTVSGNLTSCVSNPTLPTGLSINNLCEISGTPTVAQVSASYTIIATNGGGSTSATISIAVTTVNRKIFVTSAAYSPGVQCLPFTKLSRRWIRTYKLGVSAKYILFSNGRSDNDRNYQCQCTLTGYVCKSSYSSFKVLDWIKQ